MAIKRLARDVPLAIGYTRVSTIDQATDGASLDAQRGALHAEADRRSWDLEVVADEGFSGKDLRRPALVSALDRLDRGEADALLVLRLDRVSRSVADFAGLVARANHRGWRLVICDPALDTADGAGRFTAHVLAAAAEYERDLIRARTREGMAQRRAEGIHLGAPRIITKAVVDRILALRADGQSMRAIAAKLTADGVPTARGGRAWSSSTIQAVLGAATTIEMPGAVGPDS